MKIILLTAYVLNNLNLMCILCLVTMVDDGDDDDDDDDKGSYARILIFAIIGIFNFTLSCQQCIVLHIIVTTTHLCGPYLYDRIWVGFNVNVRQV